MTSLTFAEAMALDPSDVEVSFSGALWRPLRDQEGAHELRAFRIAHFRRARPRRSLVQDMNTRDYGDAELSLRAMDHAIRAVCEYLRMKQAEEMAGPCKRSLPETQAVWAARIEREFLEER